MQCFDVLLHKLCAKLQLWLMGKGPKPGRRWVFLSPQLMLYQIHSKIRFIQQRTQVEGQKLGMTKFTMSDLMGGGK